SHPFYKKGNERKYPVSPGASHPFYKKGNERNDMKKSAVKKMNILVTNDDGILSEGSLPLLDALSEFGTVAAVLPDRMRSACSHSISLHNALRLRKIRKGVYVSDGTPVDCVRLGILRVFKDDVDFVISGINAGPNMGDDLNYSGTVAAAREAAFMGVKSAAVSLVLKKRHDFSAATEILKKIFPTLVKTKLSKGAFFNINIPDVAPEKIRGVKIVKQGKRIYDRAATERIDPRGDNYYWLAGGKLSGFMLKGTDIEALENNYISVMPVTLDHTSYVDLKALAGKSFRL
ncbi:MAG: 5'/3'-nucleotidase SurE, partial [Elusimicrobia bacterium CG_4_10_14_3_um_filter_49_12_50_7]